MVTTQAPPPREKNDAERLADRALELSRLAIAGHPSAGIRRPVLWIILLLAILLIASDSEHPERLLIGGIAMLAGVILAMSDQLA